MIKPDADTYTPGKLSANADAIRFWLLFIPALSVYLITDREVKIIYLVPVLWIAFDMVRFRFDYKIREKRMLYAFLLYMLIVSFSLISSMVQSNQQVLFRDIFVIGSPLLMFFNYSEKPRKPGMILFIIFSLIYLASIYDQLRLFNLDDFSVLNVLRPNDTKTENNFGVVFGLFSLHFLMNKKWRWFAVSIFVSLMVSKRALVIGFFVASIYLTVMTLTGWRKAKVKKVPLFLLFICLGLEAVFLVEIGEYLLEILGMGDLNIARFLMGRDKLLLALREHSFDFSIGSFFGHGPGTADTYLAFKGTGWGDISDIPFNPHNDHMKLMYDYGYVGYILFFFVLFNFYAATFMGSVLLVYTITLFCFDNSLIFIIYAIVAGFLGSEYRRDEQDRLKL